jgi:YHS domain-containing protein
MKRDPVCNLAVDEAAAFTLNQDGKTFYFCSISCRDKFLIEGEQKTSPGAKSPAAEKRSREARI